MIRGTVILMTCCLIGFMLTSLAIIVSDWIKRARKKNEKYKYFVYFIAPYDEDCDFTSSILVSDIEEFLNTFDFELNDIAQVLRMDISMESKPTETIYLWHPENHPNCRCKTEPIKEEKHVEYNYLVKINQNGRTNEFHFASEILCKDIDELQILMLSLAPSIFSIDSLDYLDLKNEAQRVMIQTTEDTIVYNKHNTSDILFFRPDLPEPDPVMYTYEVFYFDGNNAAWFRFDSSIRYEDFISARNIVVKNHVPYILPSQIESIVMYDKTSGKRIETFVREDTPDTIDTIQQKMEKDKTVRNYNSYSLLNGDGSDEPTDKEKQNFVELCIEYPEKVLTCSNVYRLSETCGYLTFKSYNGINVSSHKYDVSKYYGYSINRTNKEE